MVRDALDYVLLLLLVLATIGLFVLGGSALNSDSGELARDPCAQVRGVSVDVEGENVCMESGSALRVSRGSSSRAGGR